MINPIYIKPKLNIIINIVKIPVATPTIVLPNSSIATVVVNADELKFAILLPINIALIILLWFSVTFKTRCALLFPASASVLSFILFTVVSDVSADEKKADAANKDSSSNILNGSKINSLL